MPVTSLFGSGPAGDSSTQTSVGERAELQTWFPVATHKFIVLMISTLSLYRPYWIYQQWKHIKLQSKQPLSPLWRTVFSVIWIIPLLINIRDSALSARIKVHWSPELLGAAMILIGMGSYAGSSPEYVWLGLIGNVALTMPVVRTCQAVNAVAGHPQGLNNRYSFVNAVVIVFGLLVAAFVGLEMLISNGILVPYGVVSAAEMRAADLDRLRSAGVLEAEEQVELFVSTGLFSIMEQGSVLTDRRAIAYETFDGELTVLGVKYLQIANVSVEFAKGVFDYTRIAITTDAGELFFLLVPSEEGGDRRFLEALRTKVRSGIT